MTQRIPFSEASVNKTINHEQLNQIIEAILAGKYSWACFLLLRCTGYDPVHYIPYRTYNRLVKENNQASKLSRNAISDNSVDNQLSKTRADNTSSQQRLSKINDLVYLEVVGEQHTPIRGGGNLSQWLNRKIRDYTFRKISRLHFPEN